MGRKSQSFIFVVDTEQYAGNFERQLCAFMTGNVGECGVGDEEAKAYAKQTKREPLDFLEFRPDEHGCARPASIYDTPGWFNHGHGGHFRDGDEVAALAHYKQEVEKYCQNQIKAVKSWKWAKPSEQAELKRLRGEIAAAKKRKTVTKYAAALSVAIYCSRRPTEEEIKFLKDRANGFNAYRKQSEYEWERSPITITGFRLITESKKATSEAV